MNKKQVLWILLDLVFLIIFNTIFFLLGGVHNKASVWVAYGFIHFSYIMLLLTPSLCKRRSEQIEMRLSVDSVSLLYFWVTFVMGVVFIIVKPDTVKICVVANVVITGVYAIVLLTSLLANEYTADDLDIHDEELDYVKRGSSELRALIGLANDKKTAKQVEFLYDLIYSSPVKSHPSVKVYEGNVLALIEQLRTDIANGDDTNIHSTMDKIKENAGLRNRGLQIQSQR